MILQPTSGSHLTVMRTEYSSLMRQGCPLRFNHYRYCRKSILDQQSDATIIHNLICSQVVEETIFAEGGKAVRSRVGHSHIKKLMAETGAEFAGEHSGHYYFKETFVDSGIIAA